MKVILTTSEILAKFGLSSDTELIIEDNNSSTPDNDGWISNIGRSKDGHPDSLDGHFLVEVRFRDNKSVSQADGWISNWKETDNDPNDIVAYRILVD